MQRIVLGVSGSIAAYKSVLLVRLLVKAGKEVKVIMTPTAGEFVAPLTFSTLSKHPVSIDLIDGDQWSNHVDLGLWADAFVVAPATATTISKMANGQSDNMLVATYLSAKCPVFIAPAMDLDMWKHPATQANIQKLMSYGDKIIPVGHGELASGLVGDGRMAEPEDIIAFLDQDLKKKPDLKGKTVVITAGPTQESLDPVRFISNHSTGTMGISLAEECQLRGAEVHLVLGPTTKRPKKTVNVHLVKSAQDMYDVCEDLHEKSDIMIFAAAVADYKPAVQSDKKIKKGKRDMNSLPLDRTIDIAGTLGNKKQANQIHVGFALETNDESKNAQSKLDKKNFDLIVLNSLRVEGAGFGHDTNQITIYGSDGKSQPFELKDKREVAVDIIDYLIPYLTK